MIATNCSVCSVAFPAIVRCFVALAARAAAAAARKTTEAAGRDPAVTLNKDRVPIGSPVSSPTGSSSRQRARSTRTTGCSCTSRSDGEQMWTDDHLPPTPDDAVEAGPDGRVHAHHLRAELPRTSARPRPPRAVRPPTRQAPDADGAGSRPARNTWSRSSSCCRSPRTSS